jgi:hypothetical protein
MPNAVGSVEAARDLALIAVHRDPLGSPAQVELQGDTLHLRGTIAQGSADRFRVALGHSRRARLVVLTSEGGRLAEAFEIGELIRNRGMSTMAFEECNSACTVVLLSGRERSAAADAIVGFHQSTMSGNSRLDDEFMTEEMRVFFEDRGVAKGFIDHAFSTMSNDLWVPTAEEMLAANFLSAKAPASNLAIGGR